MPNRLPICSPPGVPWYQLPARYASAKTRSAAPPPISAALEASRRKCRWNSPAMKPSGRRRNAGPRRSDGWSTWRRGSRTSPTARWRRGPAPARRCRADQAVGHAAHALDPAAMVVEARARHALGERLAQYVEIGRGRPGTSFTTTMRGTGRSSSASPVPSHGSSSAANSSREWAARPRCPRSCRRWRRRWPVGLGVAAGRRTIWMVTSRATRRLPVARRGADQHDRADRQRRRETS